MTNDNLSKTTSLRALLSETADAQVLAQSKFIQNGIVLNDHLSRKQ
jgi:hypothetical protein